MTVIVREEKDGNRFSEQDVLQCKDHLAKAIVRSLLIGQTEAMIEMMLDEQQMLDPEDTTRNGLQNMLGDVKRNAEQYWDDVVADFAATVTQALNEAKYGAIVTGIKYDLAGNISDVEVDVTVS